MDKRYMFCRANLEATRADGGSEAVIEGYFAIFNQETELWPGAFEEIAPGAFTNSLKNNEILLLLNHNTDQAIAITGENLELREDSVGLFGRAKLNLEDPDAKRAYEKVKAKIVKGCSFGFNIPPGGEKVDYRSDGSVKWTLIDTDTKEVSVTPFPQYTQTSIQARKADYRAQVQRRMEQKKHDLKERLQKWH